MISFLNFLMILQATTFNNASPSCTSFIIRDTFGLPGPDRRPFAASGASPAGLAYKYCQNINK